MRTLKPKDICGYLPYELKGLNSDNMFKPIQIDNVYGIIQYFDTNEQERGWLSNFNIKPILYPLLALYKPMPDGTIPIVECAKIVYPVRKWIFAEKEKINAAITVSGMSLFMYDAYDGFKLRYKGVISDVLNQYQLFDYLNSLKIDYRGLINNGLAVSVYDLENNPYK